MTHKPTEAMMSALETVMRPRGLTAIGVPPPPRHPETLQCEVVAASLAAGIIAASGQPYTPAEAVGVWRAVLAKLRDDVADGLTE